MIIVATTSLPAVDRPNERRTLMSINQARSPICNVKSDVGSNSQKRVIHSTIKVLHHSTCVPTFLCSLSRACPNEQEDKLQCGGTNISNTPEREQSFLHQEGGGGDNYFYMKGEGHTFMLDTVLAMMMLINRWL